MKTSKYNFFRKIYNRGADCWLAYNSFKNSLAVITEDNFAEYKKFEKNNNYILTEDLFEKLYDGGYIIEDDVSELELLNFEKEEERFNHSKLTMTIAPTMDCNFRCAYCYEKNRYENVQMTEEIIEAIIEFVKSKVKNLSLVTVAWYGGEPLMAINIIQTLSKQLIEVCEKNDIEYEAVIVTNGYLLDEKRAIILKEAKIKSVQITLDGLENKHNEKRPLKNGGKTYSRIIENIRNNAPYFDEINIRVNCDKNNIKDYCKLYQEIKNYNVENIKMYASPIRDLDCYSCGGCFSRIEFREFERNVYKKLGEDAYRRFIMDRYPDRGANYCGAQLNNNLIIAADGSMYKCWADVGDAKRSFGNICDIENIDICKFIMYNNAVKGEECKICTFYPICAGGCPHENAMNKEDVCEYNEKIITDYLTEIIDYKTVSCR
ncbi:MAG: radical SAM protein [Pseudobutyrivibrio sp.]|uniref:radical SAM/SPASM domain-containing protein n=1 Tax=Pseudobutyrivibrio sp. TaxID=2014367 RepID=UPI0025D6C39E|nr:radical SAM protein [Pseudobutyrivibrio sp.]MBQ6462850.1 radical SAM protein [Pseudobutyrivibrio sp.]